MTLRDRTFLVRSTIGDRSRRTAHALAHSRYSPASRRSDVFNLDLHIAVISDVRDVLESRDHSLTSWSISGHTWVFGHGRDPVAIVNERTWQALDARLVRRFQRVYGGYLRTFRGFVATYPPGFALLYEGLPGPTLAVCATRYEWPFTHDPDRWDWLDASLRRGAETNSITLVANNRADADYVANYTGLQPTHIPSACSYIAPTYSGRSGSVVVATKRDRLARIIATDLKCDAVPLRAGLGQRYSWSQLYEHRAIVVIPYNVSIMSIFEHYSACAPIYIPTRDFLKQLMKQYPDEALSDLSFGQVTGHPAAARPHADMDLNNVRDVQIVDWYLDRADFYDQSWMPSIRQFESWSHLDQLLETDDHVSISRQMASEKPQRLARIAALWEKVEWLRQIAASD